MSVRGRGPRCGIDPSSGSVAPPFPCAALAVAATLPWWLTHLQTVGSGILALGSTHWSDAVILLVGGLILSRLCYLAAVSQVAQVARLMQVAFDLYRHAILKQMDLTLPSNLKAERGLWNQLTHQVLASEAALMFERLT